MDKSIKPYPFLKESNIEKHLFQHGLVCPDCFDSAMGFDDEKSIKTKSVINNMFYII